MEFKSNHKCFFFRRWSIVNFSDFQFLVSECNEISDLTNNLFRYFFLVSEADIILLLISLYLSWTKLTSGKWYSDS